MAGEIHNLTDTWNDGGTTFTSIKMNVTDTASAAASLLLDLQVGSASKFSVAKGAGAYFSANTFELRNSTNAQQLNVYQSYTDASNYERLIVGVSGSSSIFGNEKLGTGTARDLLLRSAKDLYFQCNGSDTRWYMQAAGHLLPWFGNSYDIGSSSRTVRDLYIAGDIVQAAYHEMTEMTAPSAGAANTVRIYAVDNGSGKTQLMALFNSGAAQQIAIEP